MRTRLFLRTTEFLWQEGHTAHETYEEAQNETLLILELYRKLAEDFLAMPVHTGLKSESEKFAGAEFTYCIEAMMRDKRALQAGTSHNLGQNFAKAFDVKFQTKDNVEEYVYATSWGVSTRLVGGVIMTHGDEKGLRLPPRIAPFQVVVIPIYKTEEDMNTIKDFMNPIIKELQNKNVRVHEDWRKESPGFKFNEWEMKGAPIRLEIGLRDIQKNCATIARRDNGEKITINKIKIADEAILMLDDIQKNLFKQALKFREDSTFEVDSYDDFKKIIKETGGFVRCGWDGNKETEQAIKDETKATIRVIPFDENPKDLLCIYSGKPAKHEVIFAKAY
jgi:prolyl-tRNA synthetase